MKVARLHASGDIHLHEEPRPIPGPGDALLHVTAVGLCGSDLHWFKQGSIGDAHLERPLVLGHEFAATLESGTASLDFARSSAGQPAAVDPAIPCEQCEFCRAGHPNLCPTVRFAGHGEVDGALREWIAWPTRLLHPLPDGLNACDGAMLEPLGVALHAIDLGKLKPGMTVGVFGCGTIGLLVLQLARLAGAAALVATEPLAHRLEAAQGYGAQPWDHYQGVDVAFECAGENAAVEDAVQAVKPGGGVILVGIPDEDLTSFTASVARRKGLTLKLSRRMKHTYPRAIQLVAKGMVDVRSLVTHRFPLEKTAEAFAVAQRREGIKVIIEIA
ncbi:MAG: alcohol dehydrogenase catalytic domain-containing protein [Chloroflexota bacterium]